MKRFTVMCAAACVTLLPVFAPAQDLVQTAGKNAKVVLDNEDVRVIELNMPADAPHASVATWPRRAVSRQRLLSSRS